MQAKERRSEDMPDLRILFRIGLGFIWIRGPDPKSIQQGQNGHQRKIKPFHDVNSLETWSFSWSLKVI